MIILKEHLFDRLIIPDYIYLSKATQALFINEKKNFYKPE